MEKLAVVIPYRDRKAHLDIFAPYMNGYFAGVGIKEYKIIVVEQANKNKFNRGTLINIGFDYIKDKSDYISPHDVDLLPEVNCDYSFPENPSHLIAGRSQASYKQEPAYFGGVNAFQNEHFFNANGFSNCYSGYGAEDDDLKLRFLSKGYSLEQRHGYYMSLDHDYSYVDPSNLERNRRQYYSILNGNKVIAEKDGLSDLNYEIKEVKSDNVLNMDHIFVDFNEYNFEDYQ